MLNLFQTIKCSLHLAFCMAVFFNFSGCSRSINDDGSIMLQGISRGADSSIKKDGDVSESPSIGPREAAVSVAFQDTSVQGGKLGGEIQVSRASDESTILEYRVYWATGPNAKLPDTQPLVKLPKGSPTLNFSLPEATIIPALAQYFLVLTANSSGEMSRGVSVLIEDKGVPQNAATSVEFTDSNSSGGKLTGLISISRAADESDISHYVIYLGKDDGTKLSKMPLAELDKSTITLGYVLQDFEKPQEAKFFLVYSKNRNGEMASCIALQILDLGVPRNGAVSASFVDNNSSGGRLSGTISISRASDESDISHYSVYWATGDGTKISSIPIAVLEKASHPLGYDLQDIAKPEEAKSFLVYSKNEDGEMATGVVVLITDLGVPKHAVVAASFTDTNSGGDKLTGAITISKAADESDLTHYVIYWGKENKTKLFDVPIATLAKSSASLSFALNDVEKPHDAEYFLVFSKNKDGEMATGVEVQIVDLGVPKNGPVSVSFSDSNLNGGKLTGIISINKATDESDITHYVIYWGKADGTKLYNTPVKALEKSTSSLTHDLQDVDKPEGAKSLLVFSKNGEGEMSHGVAALIIDRGVPTHAAALLSFEDSNVNAGKLTGTIVVSKADNESDVVDYVLYWGKEDRTKLSPLPFAVLKKSSNPLIFSLTNVDKPSEAKHILVFSRNKDGEMSSGVSAPIIDLGVPRNAALSGTFIDSNLNGGKLTGPIVISRAVDESDITHYLIYWGKEDGTKLFSTPIAILEKGLSPLSYAIQDVDKLKEAKYFLIFSKNDSGEMSSGFIIPIIDKAHMQVASGRYHTCALMDDKTVKCWGDNTYGQLGDNTTTGKLSPNPVSGLSKVLSVSLGSNHTCALLEDKTVKCWGHNGSGQLGDGTTTNKYLPTPVAGLNNVTSIAAGTSHVCALLEDSTIKCWGDNSSGQLGDGTTTRRTTAVSVSGLNQVNSVSLGSNHTCALMADKTVKCWGDNSSGQLGDGSATQRRIAASVSGLAQVSSISMGYSHSCSLLEDKTLRCWGKNTDGQLGDGTTSNQFSATTVLGLVSVSSISMGADHSCALMLDNTVKCWGSSASGQLGNGFSNKSVPTLVQNLNSASSVSSGLAHNCSLIADDRSIKCWGDNIAGQLGDGTTTFKLSPTAVIGL